MIDRLYLEQYSLFHVASTGDLSLPTFSIPGVLSPRAYLLSYKP